MGELLWFFPETEEELKDILTSEEGLVPHGGGTGLLRGDIRRYRGLLDLGRLNLTYVKEENGFVEMGATATYGEILRYFERENPEALLYKSLLNSATTPLRNRITIGGSIAYFPTWSDVMGPLFALSAEIYLTGKIEGWFKILDYVSQRNLHQKTVILRVRYRKNNDTGYSAHFRAVRTRVDHPAFTITLLLDVKHKKISGASFYVVGTKDRFKKLSLLEREVVGRDISSINPESLKVDEVEFYGKPQFSPEYQKLLYDTEVRRTLLEILESVK